MAQFVRVWVLLLVLGAASTASKTCDPTIAIGTLLDRARNGCQSLAFSSNENDFLLPLSASVASLRQRSDRHAALLQRISGCEKISILKASLPFSVEGDPLGYAARQLFNPRAVTASGSPTLFSLGMLLRL